jgi:predicted permease
MEGSMVSLVSDLRQALKSITRHPAYCTATIFSLAGATALNVVAFALVDGLFLRPLPVPNQDRIVAVVTRDNGSSLSLPISYPNYLSVRAQARSLRFLSAYQFAEVSLTSDPPQKIIGQIVTGNFFDLLGVKPQLGRNISPADDSVDNPQFVVVLSDSLWRQRFAADPSILGKVVQLNRQSFTVIGIGPRGFHGTRRQIRTQFWAPVQASTALMPLMGKLNDRDWRLFRVLGLTAPHEETWRVHAEIRSLGEQLEQDYPAANKGQSLQVVSFLDEAIGPNSRDAISRACSGLLAIALLAMLGTGINSSNLLLTSFAARRGEIGVRLAIGAPRSRLIRQFALESLVLVAGSLALGTALAVECYRLLTSIHNPFTGVEAMQLDWRLAAWVLGTALAVMGAGTLPAARAAASISFLALSDESRYCSRRHTILQNSLGALQMAFTIVFLSIAGWLTMGVLKSKQSDLGFTPQGLRIVSLDLKSAGYKEGKGFAFCRRARAEIAALPGVNAVEIADLKPFSGVSLLRQVQPVNSPDTALLAPVKSVTKGYFKALGLRFLSGGTFQESGSYPVAVVNSELASKLWPHGNPIGKQFQLDTEKTPVTIAGVVGNSREISLEGPVQPLVYLPFHQHYSPTVVFYVRSSRTPEDIEKSISLALSYLDRQLPLDFTDADQLIKDALWVKTLGQRLFLLLGLTTLAISMIGTYALTRLYLRARHRDFAIRIALGAEFASLAKLTFRSRLPTTLAGLFFGVLTSMEAGRLLPGSTGGGWILTLVVALTLVVSTVATLLATRELGRATLRASLMRS